MQHIDLTTAVRELEAVVKGNEDLVYESTDVLGWCSYVDGKNTPGCGVGQMFRRLGATEDELNYFDTEGGVRALVEHHLISIHVSAARFLARFQAEQDTETPWGEALAEAKREVGLDEV